MQPGTINAVLGSPEDINRLQLTQPQQQQVDPRVIAGSIKNMMRSYDAAEVNDARATNIYSSSKGLLGELPGN